MKTILLIVSALTFFFLDPTFEVPYSRLESGFNSNNASSIIALGKEKVLVKIEDKEGAYNHAQAELILRDFFVKKPGGSFSYTFKGKETEDGVFSMGLYATKNEKFIISVRFKKMATSYQFESLTIKK